MIVIAVWILWYLAIWAIYGKRIFRLGGRRREKEIHRKNKEIINLDNNYINNIHIFAKRSGEEHSIPEVSRKRPLELEATQRGDESDDLHKSIEELKRLQEQRDHIGGLEKLMDEEGIDPEDP